MWHYNYIEPSLSVTESTIPPPATESTPLPPSTEKSTPPPSQTGKTYWDDIQIQYSKLTIII